MVVIDFETRSKVDLRKCGASVYARDESTSILCLAYRHIGEEEVRLWTPQLNRTPEKTGPFDLFHAVEAGEWIHAHNVFFERNIWHWICHKQWGWPDVPAENWRCSLAACSRLALPRKLEEAGSAVGLEMQKDKAGHQVMLRLSKPKKPSKKDPSIWDNDPTKFRILYDYCEQDVRAEAELIDTIEDLTPSELKVWQLDQRINLIGIPVDRDAARLAIQMADGVAEQACQELQQITTDVTSPGQVQRVRTWLEEQGHPLPNLSRETVEAALTRDLPPSVRRVLEIRLETAKASTKKLQAMLDRCDEDGRVRGNLVYHGANTGRWAGAGIQIQNFPRGDLKPYEIALVHDCLGDPHVMDLLLGQPLDCLSSSLRSFIKAEDGKRLLVCDFASIEARVLAWVAGQADLTQIFFDGGDVYKEMASGIYDVPVEEITKDQRQMGKTAILGCGYGMGAKAFVSACHVMAGVKISRKFAKKVVQAYRKKNDRISSFWREINSACIRTLETGHKHAVGRIVISTDGEWMKLQLPSGRQLHYREPELVEVRAPWSQGLAGDLFGPVELEDKLEELDIDLGDRVEDHWEECSVPKGLMATLLALGVSAELQEKEPQYVTQIQFKGVVSPSRKWGTKRTYGGSLTENIVQAIARDFLVEAMLRLDRAGYPIIATVHDEVICEVPDGQGSLEEFEQLMSQVPAWGRGCPIAVESYEAERYRK